MIQVGQFAIFGASDKTPTPKGLKRIIMPPIGPDVFGCGWEAETQAALLALPSHITRGCSFAEIGAGSGILSVAAKLLGAGKCWATEKAPAALETAPKVFKANKVEVTLVADTFPPEPVDVAVVSISSDFAQKYKHEIMARKVLVVHDDATVEVIE